VGEVERVMEREVSDTVNLWGRPRVGRRKRETIFVEHLYGGGSLRGLMGKVGLGCYFSRANGGGGGRKWSLMWSLGAVFE